MRFCEFCKNLHGGPCFARYKVEKLFVCAKHLNKAIEQQKTKKVVVEK